MKIAYIIIKDQKQSKNKSCGIFLHKNKEAKEVKGRQRLVLIKDLVGVLKDGVNNLDLPACIGDGCGSVTAHEGRTENDSQVVRVHAVGVCIVHDSVEMERDGTQSGIVGIREAVDNGVQRVTTDNIIFLLCW